MERIAKQIIFSGRVQGVGFRFTALRIANRHFLTGFVRNVPNGTVQMLAQGPSADIDDCITEIKETFGRYITDTEIIDVPIQPQYTGFKITF